MDETIDPRKDDWSDKIPRSLYLEGIGKMAHTFGGDKVAEAFGLGAFQLTRLRGRNDADNLRLVEVWFRGVHSDVGGGNENRGLNWISLDWMFANARRHGLDIDQAAVDRTEKHSTDPRNIKPHHVAVGPRRETFPTDLLHQSVQLDPNDTSHQRNDPTVALTRIDNDGTSAAPSNA